MDSILIKQIVDEQLAEKGITDGKVYILERKWGYVVQIDYANDRKHANELFDKKGNIINPISDFQSDAGGIYATEVMEVIERKCSSEVVEYLKQTYGTEIMEERLRGVTKKREIALTSSIKYRELDDNHFIIPSSGKDGIGNILFFVKPDNSVTYKGYIQGTILDNILTEDKKLMKQKQVLSRIEIDKTRDEFEYFFYSWDENCRVSDKWSKLYRPEDTFQVQDSLINGMKLPREFSLDILNYMQSNEAWLAILNLNSKDNKRHEHFVCLIGIDGIPLMDLTYITDTYEIKTIPLKKKKIGEVDAIKVLLQNHMDQKLLRIEETKRENKENLTASFFQQTGLTMNNTKSIPDGNAFEELDEWNGIK